jgi:hypothetical protein
MLVRGQPTVIVDEFEHNPYAPALEGVVRGGVEVDGRAMHSP